MPAEQPPGAIVAPGAPVTIMKWAMMWLPYVGLALPNAFGDGLVGLRAIYLGVAPPVQHGPTLIRNLAHIKLLEKPKERLRGPVGGSELDTDTFDEIYIEPHVLRWYPIVDAIGQLDDLPG